MCNLERSLWRLNGIIQLRSLGWQNHHGTWQYLIIFIELGDSGGLSESSSKKTRKSGAIWTDIELESIGLLKQSERIKNDLAVSLLGGQRGGNKK